jgi:hypothetical protein
MSDPVPINGDATPFLLEVGGTLALVFAGQVEPHVAAVQVNGKRCLVGTHGWISEPLPMEPGMQVRIVWLDPSGATVRSIDTGPLEPDKLRPLFSSEWTAYGPLL